MIKIIKLILGIYEVYGEELLVLSDPIMTKEGYEYDIKATGLKFKDYYFLWICYKTKKWKEDQ